MASDPVGVGCGCQSRRGDILTRVVRATWDHGAMSASSTESSLGVVPRVATFFALYPEPLGLDDGTYYCNILDSPVRGFPNTIALHLKEGTPPIWLNPVAYDHLFVSVRFHRGQRPRDSFDERETELSEVIQAIGGVAFPPLTPLAGSKDKVAAAERASDEEQPSFYTVVEMTTQVVFPRQSFWEPCNPDDNIMGPTLTRCFNELIRTVNAYRFAEKILIPTPARERIGPLIIAATRPADPGQGGWDASVHEVFNYFAAAHASRLIGTESPTTLQTMTDYMRLEAIGHPSIAAMQLQEDLNVAFYRDGNFRGTVMFAHAASEVTLDTALMSMLFEEGLEPVGAAGIFNKPLKTRLLTEYHERLGGSWTPQGTKPVAVWLRDLLLLRHRVAHGGYLPSYEEASAAREAHFALGTYLRDRLASRMRKYPFTAGFLVTKGGFERRNIRTKAAEAAVNASTIDALREFASWRTELIRVRA